MTASPPSSPVAAAAAGALVQQRALVSDLAARARKIVTPTPRQLWVVEMWARVAVAHPSADFDDMARLADVLILAADAAEMVGEAAQASLYRAEIISLTTEIADGGSEAADRAALQLDRLVADCSLIEVDTARAMRRRAQRPEVQMCSTLTRDLRALLAPALDRAGLIADTVEHELATGHLMLWRFAGFCVTTEVDQDDICNIRLGGGTGARAAIGPLEKAITSYPAHSGVTTYRIWGRKGWRRLFPHWRDCGVEEGLVVLERDA